MGQKLKTEPEEGGAYETNIKIKKEAEDLTPEDEERRRRRRERNKVAATKCRNKKKEKTTILVAESEIVEVQNASLKAEVARLDAEKRRLTTILAQHAPNCAKKRRLCTGTEEVPPETTVSQEEQYDMTHTFRRQQCLEARTAEAPVGLVPARSSIATEATVQTERAKSATVTSRGPSSPKPKITSTAVERCTTCI